jgi:hypothetical protein
MSDAQIISLASLLFPMLVSLCAYLYKRLVPPSRQAQLDHAKSLARTVAQGVEQTCSALTGPNKKAEAVRLINLLLKEAGITASPTLVDALIEQAVYAINANLPDPQVTQSVPVVRS